jgi:hypothetical protein
MNTRVSSSGSSAGPSRRRARSEALTALERLVCLIAVVVITRIFLWNNVAATLSEFPRTGVVAMAEVSEASFAETIEISDPPPYVDEFVGWHALQCLAASFECGVDWQDARRPKTIV